MGEESESGPKVSVAEMVTSEPVEAPDGSMWWMGVPDMIVGFQEPVLAVSYTHLTLPTNREV